MAALQIYIENDFTLTQFWVKVPEQELCCILLLLTTKTVGSFLAKQGRFEISARVTNERKCASSHGVAQGMVRKILGSEYLVQIPSSRSV